jgi:hypothetical protein
MSRKKQEIDGRWRIGLTNLAGLPNYLRRTNNFCNSGNFAIIQSRKAQNAIGRLMAVMDKPTLPSQLPAETPQRDINPPEAKAIIAPMKARANEMIAMGSQPVVRIGSTIKQ